MIGSAIKKYAAENNLTVKNGVAFGTYKGFLITLQDGPNIKKASFCVNVSEEAVKTELLTHFGDRAYRKQYGIAMGDIGTGYIDVTFVDTGRKTMKHIIEFLDTFTDMLNSYKLNDKTVCASCGQSLMGQAVTPVLKDGRAMYMHTACVDSYNENAEVQNIKDRQDGSVLTGAVGALIGGIIGAIPWAIAYYFGWFVAWLGLIIAFAAKKGYELLHGKSSKAKAVVIILVTVFCVALAEAAAGIVTVHTQIVNDPELSQYSFTLMSLIRIFFNAVAYDAEIRRSIIADFALGLLFAALGIGSTIREIFSATSLKSGKVTRLD